MSVFETAVKYGLPMVPKPLVGRVASRYVAGPTLEDAVAAIGRLNAEGAMCTADVLGEEVMEKERAEAAVADYLRLFDAIAEHSLDCNVSVKPTMLGLKIDPAFCRDNIARLLERATEYRSFLRIDMEDHTCVDATLEVYRQLRERFDNVGVVLQAYMRRTLDDIQQLLPLQPNVRMCKGIYREPREVAWKAFETIRENFIAATERLLAGGGYVGIATHDEHLVWAGMEMVQRLGLGRNDYEFQMLLGVEPQLRQIILAAGHRLRVYVPYGTDWYAYSMRRLRENPSVARHVVRAMAGRPQAEAPRRG